jgi:hypothetical protein
MTRSVSNPQTALAMQKEAKRLRTEFQSYLEDLELYSKPAFWKAIANEKKAKKYKTLSEFRKRTGL